MNSNFNPVSIQDRLKDIWYNYKKYIILSVCLIVVLVITIVLLSPKESKLTKYSNIERIMVLNAQNYVKNNNIEGNIYVSLNNLNIKIDDELKCNTLSGVYKENDSYRSYLICENYKSQAIKEMEEANESLKEYAILNGDNPSIVNKSIYQEDGVKTDYQVTIKGNDIDNGFNIITYYINEDGKNIGELKRIVIAEEIEGNYPTLTLVGEKTKSIPQGSKYTEQGYSAIDERDGNITDNVVVTGIVDENTPGTYKLTYSITNSRKKATTETRTIVVNESENIDLDISHALDPSAVTKKSVTIKLSINGNGYKSTKLPDNSEKTSNEVTYIVYKNGTYDFLVYDKNNNSEVYSVTVKNINKEPPKGTCKVTYENNKSTLEIKPEEPTLIKNYQVYNDDKLLETITKDTYVFNDYPRGTKVKLVDVENQNRVISCKITGNDVIYNDYGRSGWVYHNSNSSELKPYASSTMAFAEYVPEKAVSSGDKLPLIIWLHGLGEVKHTSDGADKCPHSYCLLSSSFVKVTGNWSQTGLKNIPAIMMAPHLDSPGWGHALTTIRAMIKYAKDKYNIDENRIVLIGHSHGGYGVPVIYSHDKNMYSALIIMSGANDRPDSSYANDLKTMPLKGYSENGLVGSSMINFFNNLGRRDDLTIYAGESHGQVPKRALLEDNNNDQVSDLIFWALSQRKK